MQPFRTLLASAALTAVAIAQCPQGASAGLVKWTSGSGYASTFGVDDESITSPPVSLVPAFFMPGAVGTLDRMWVNVNGEIYFTDSTLGLTQPATGASFGIDSAAEMRGAAVGASARIAVLGGDHQGSIAAGAAQAVAIDTGVAGQVTVTWVDLRRFNNATGDRFSFQAVITLATGVVQLNYGSTFPVTGFTGRFVGISIGNNIADPGNVDLNVAPVSATGIRYQSFTGVAPHVWDLSGQSVTFSPVGPGYSTTIAPYVAPTCASNVTYGNGCYAKGNSVHTVFPDSPSAKATLDGNKVTWTTAADPKLLTPMRYKTSWVPGGGGAANFFSNTPVALTFTDDDDGEVTYTPAGGVNTPFGNVATITISVNGILTMAATPNNPSDFTPASADLTSNTLAPNLAFYGAWRDYLLSDTAPAVNGTITTEESGNMLYVSWNAVEAYPTAVANPATWQFQVDKTTGDVAVVYVSMDPSATVSATVVGATLAGAGTAPGEIRLEAETNQILDGADLAPLTLTATRGVIGQPQTFTASNVPDLGGGLGFSFLFFANLPFPGGLELGGILDAPHCYHQVLGTAFVNMTGTAPNATFTWTPGAVPNDVFSFNVLSLANFGVYNAGGWLTSNGVTSTYQNQ